MIEIKIWRDPYEIGVPITKPRKVTLVPGLTVLVGCNGSGKTTLINNMNEQLGQDNIPHVLYNNLTNGSSSAIESIMSGFSDFEDDNIQTAASLWTASEGESIRMNLIRQSSVYNVFLKKGIFENRQYKFNQALASAINKEYKSPEEITDKRRVFLYDATDSGVSIDSICELKNMFYGILEVAAELGVEAYVVISANEYELCRGTQCLDVVNGKYLEFNDYEEYREFIMKSREWKEKRLDKQAEWAAKQLEREKKKFYKLKEKVNDQIQEIKSSNRSDIDKRRGIDLAKRRLSDFKYQCRYFKVPKEDLE